VIREEGLAIGAPLLDLLPYMPANGSEYAGVVFHLEVAGQVADLFGLVTRYESVATKEGKVFGYRWADLYCVVKGNYPTAPELRDMLDKAKRWWAPFRGEMVEGRPLGTGTFRDRADFRIVVGGVVQGLRKHGIRPTQEKVAEFLTTDCTYRERRSRSDGKTDISNVDTRQLRRWLQEFGYVSWTTFLGDVQTP
jgi:hypothetical protein